MVPKMFIKSNLSIDHDTFLGFFNVNMICSTYMIYDNIRIVD